MVDKPVDAGYNLWEEISPRRQEGDMEDPRLSILNLLQRNPDSTVEDLAQTLDLSSASVRRHLDILQRDRLVTYRTTRSNPGRPSYVFSLTDAGQERLPKDYQRLSSQLIRQLHRISHDNAGSKDDSGLVESVFSLMSQESAEAYQEKYAGRSLSERAAVLLEVLGEEHFAPEVVESPEGVLVRLNNCPFRGTAMENPSVCNYDRHLISQVLESPAIRQQCITQGDRVCTYWAPQKQSPRP